MSVEESGTYDLPGSIHNNGERAFAAPSRSGIADKQ